jgi:hypothetical protein
MAKQKVTEEQKRKNKIRDDKRRAQYIKKPKDPKLLTREQLRYRNDPVYREHKKKICREYSRLKKLSMTEDELKIMNEKNKEWKHKNYGVIPKKRKELPVNPPPKKRKIDVVIKIPLPVNPSPKKRKELPPPVPPPVPPPIPKQIILIPDPQAFTDIPVDISFKKFVEKIFDVYY